MSPQVLASESFLIQNMHICRIDLSCIRNKEEETRSLKSFQGLKFFVRRFQVWCCLSHRLSRRRGYGNASESQLSTLIGITCLGIAFNPRRVKTLIPLSTTHSYDKSLSQNSHNQRIDFTILIIIFHYSYACHPKKSQSPCNEPPQHVF